MACIKCWHRMFTPPLPKGAGIIIIFHVYHTLPYHFLPLPGCALDALPGPCTAQPAGRLRPATRVQRPVCDAAPKGGARDPDPTDIIPARSLHPLHAMLQGGWGRRLVLVKPSQGILCGMQGGYLPRLLFKSSFNTDDNWTLSAQMVLWFILSVLRNESQLTKILFWVWCSCMQFDYIQLQVNIIS